MIPGILLAQKPKVPQPGKTYFFEIKNGTTRQGKLERSDSLYHYITDPATGPDKVYIQGIASFKEIKITADGYFANPHFSRYVFGPSAIPHPEGESYWNNLLFEYNTYQYGATDKLSVGMGGLLLTTLSGNVALAPNMKYSFRLSEKDHIAAGGLAFLFRLKHEKGLKTAALPFTVYTRGNSESNITAGLGWWVDDENSWSERPTYYLAGSRRISRNWVIQGEGFVLPTHVEPSTRLILLSMRNIRPTSCWDFGTLLVRLEDITIPLPVLGYTLKF